MTDHKRLIAEARMFAEARGERRDTAIVSRLADALEAATAENERLFSVLEPYTREYPNECNKRFKAEAALESALAERAVVEAQALEQAADEIEIHRQVAVYGTNGAPTFVLDEGASDLAETWLYERAAAIREGRQ